MKVVLIRVINGKK